MKGVGGGGGVGGDVTISLLCFVYLKNLTSNKYLDWWHFV